jgi:MFS family permease
VAAEGHDKPTMRRNITLHVLGGGGLVMALQFGNPEVLLPWIGHHLGVAYVLIALLVPLVESGYVISQLVLAGRAGHIPLRKRALILSGLLLAALFVLIFLAERLNPAIAAFALLAFAAAFGLGYGVFNLNNRDLVAKTVPRNLRGHVLARRAALGGVLTLGATVAIWVFLPEVAGNHVILLWLAVGAWIGAAAAYGAIVEAPSASASDAKRVSLRRSWALASCHPWFRRFLVLRTLLLSVELAVPFYAIHAASLHHTTAQRLSAFVLAMSLGLLLSGPVWGHLIDRHNALVITLSALLAAAAGICVLVMDALSDPTTPFLHAALFLPLALAAQGSTDGRTRLLLAKAPAEERPALIGLSSALLACAGTAVALVLGLAGHLHDIRTPLVLLILANLVAALYVPRAFAD